MSTPIAAHTFSPFSRVYLSQRNNAAPGSGTWSAPITIIDLTAYPGIVEAGTFSAGALDEIESSGILCQGINGMVFWGNGLPAGDTPKDVTFDPGGGSVQPDTSDYWDTSQGAWSYNGAFYALARKFPLLTVIKSTDNGTTWTALDYDNITIQGANIAAIQRVNNTLIVFAHRNTSYAFQIFDLATETWGARFGDFDNFPLLDVGGREALNCVFQFPNGDFGVLYDHDSSGSGLGVVYQLYSSGSWGPEVYLPITGAPDGTIANCVIDPGLELIHVFCFIASQSAVSGGTYSKVTHGGTVTANIFIFPARPGGSDGFGHPSIQNGKIFIPYDDQAAATNAVWVATLGGTTFFEELLPIPSTEGGHISGESIANGGSGYNIGDTGFVNGGNGLATYGVGSIGGGGAVTAISWGTGQGYSVASGVSTTRGGGQPGVGTGLTVNILSVDPSTPSCAYMMFPNGYLLPLTLACPVGGGTGTIGVPYSKTLVASGGTPPYSYSIISGALPPGLTLNSSTGTISGTPTTAGTYTYTAQVTDSLDATATAECTIVITGPPLTLACPVQNTGIIGTSYSSFLIASGGVPPYVYAIIAGALPPGLALDPFTGLISGVPTTAGVFDYTAQVTDNVGSTATASCEITISIQPNPVPTPPAGHNTLRWQVDAKDRPGRWFHHKYAHAIVAHYLVEPSASLPNSQDLYLLGPDIFISGGNTDAGTAISTFVLTPANDFGDERAQKLYPDAMLQVDGTGTLSASPAFDNAQTFAPPTVITPTGTIQQFLVNIASLGNLVLHRNIGVALSWTGGPDGPRVQAWEPAAYLQPYLSEFLVTQFINLSYPGWKFGFRLYPGLISVADVIFTIKCQDGRTFTYTIPSTAGQFKIIPMILDHGVKDLSFAFELNGQGNKFALFPDAFTVLFKGWADPEFIPLAIYKT